MHTPPVAPRNGRLPFSMLRSTGAAALLALMSCAACVSQAHDWPSPTSPHPMQQQASVAMQPPWGGLQWQGPASGPPAKPDARHCQRAPQSIELTDPSPRLQQALLARETHSKLSLADSGVAAAHRPAPAAESMRLERSTDARKSHLPPTPPAPQARPAAEPVTAGVVDDNADFGSYLSYLRRSAHLAPHTPLQLRQERDVAERYLLTVHDAAGRPVPDAEVTLHAGGRAQPLWARTDAGGRVWLHPRVHRISAGVLEVQVLKPARPGADGELRGSAILKRGQRDALQVTLDGTGASTAQVFPTRLDLVFLVDATGSMADEIDKLRRSMQAMAEQIAQLPSRPVTCYALVAYRDRGDEFFVRAHDFTSDLGAFQQVLSGLRAGGGGDYPEALNEALHTAVHHLSWRGDGTTRLVVLVGDAPPHLDTAAPWYFEDMQGALARGIKLLAIGASGLDKTGEAVWRQLAQHTGGRFVFLTYANARQPASGPGRETVHDVGHYSVETLDKLVVRLVREELARRAG